MVIITESQLYELTGGGYLDVSDDYMPDGKISASSAIDDKDGGVDYSKPETSDKHSASMARDSLYGGLFGTSYAVFPDVVRESNSDIDRNRYQLNQNIDGRTMPKDSVGRNALSNGVNGKNLPQYVRRFNEAEKEAARGDSSKLNRMGGKAAADEIRRIYRNAQNLSKNLRDAKPEGEKINSAPKVSGNGKAHTKKGVINYFNSVLL